MLRLMLKGLLVCLLAAQAAQGRHVHVQVNGHVEEFRKLQAATSPNSGSPQLSAVLRRCLADAACSSALAVAADAHQQQQQQQQRAGHDNAASNIGTTVLGTTVNAAITDIMWVDSGGDGSGGGGRGGSEALQYDGDRSVSNDGDEGQASLPLKAAAALVLFLEAVAGMYLPLLLQRLHSPQWWLSLLNCFSGGIFLSAGIIHLLPHCAEAQEALGPIGPNGGDYPLYLVLVVVGYCVVFYVERVLFDVHGEGHAHCQHSNVYSHSSYYKAISHRSQRLSRTPSITAAAVLSAAPEQLLLLRPATATAAPGTCVGRTHVHDACDSCDAKAVAIMGSGNPPGPQQGQQGQHGHGHGHQHVRHAGRPPLQAVSSLVQEAGVVAGDGNDDAESCHSDHPPRAVCVCVEEQEAEAEARGQQQHHHHQHHHHHKHDHTHTHNPQAQQPPRARHQDDLPGPSSSHGHGRANVGCGGGGSGGGARGAGEGSCEDQLRAPLLADQDREQEASAAPTPSPPGLDDVSCSGGGSGDCAVGGSDLRSLAWQHLLQQHEHQQQLLLPTPPPHPADACAYHAHHHPHPHHRYRRRSVGAGPLPDSRDSRGSSCASPTHHHHLDQPHPTADAIVTHLQSHTHAHYAHSQHHHQHHHHVIKPRFRFMHGVVLLAALALHTALECIALGLIDSRAEFLLLFAAIASHKAVSALALSSRFLREGATLGQVTGYVGPFCLVAPASILMGMYVGRVAPIARLVFSCFATGTFLYVGASEVIMEEFEGEMRADRRDISTRAARYIKFSAVLAAVALVAASGLLPEPDHH